MHGTETSLNMKPSYVMPVVQSSCCPVGIVKTGRVLHSLFRFVPCVLSVIVVLLDSW